MMKIDPETVAHTARLARLGLDQEELQAQVAHFRALLEFVADLTEAPLDGVEPMAHPLDQKQRLRPDEVTEDDRRDAFQGLAPEADDGYYLVPRVID